MGHCPFYRNEPESPFPISIIRMKAQNQTVKIIPEWPAAACSAAQPPAISGLDGASNGFLLFSSNITYTVMTFVLPNLIMLPLNWVIARKERSD